MAIILEDSRLNRQDFSARIETEFAELAVTTQLKIATPQLGSMDGSIEWKPNLEDVTSELVFKALDPLAWAHIDGKSQLNGTLSGTANLSEDLPFQLSLKMENGSRLNDIAFQSVVVEASGQAAGEHAIVEGNAELDLESGHVSATYHSLADSVFGDLVIQKADIAALLGLKSTSSFTTSIHLNASKENEKWSQMSIKMDSLVGHFEHLQLNKGFIRAELGSAGLQIDSLNLDGSFGHFTASGFLPKQPDQPPANVTFDMALNHEIGRLTQMKALGAEFGSFEAEGALIGPSGHIRLDADYTISAAYFSPMEANRVQGRLLGELGENWRLTAAELVAELSLVEVRPVVAEKATFSAAYDGTEVLASIKLHLSNARDLSGQFSWLPTEEPSRIELVDFSASFDGDEWTMAGKPALDFEKLVLLKPLVLSSGDQRIVVVSSTASNQVRNLITIQQLRIDPFAELFAYPDLGGIFGGTLTSTSADNSSVTLTGTSESYLQGSLFGSLTAYDQPVGDINLQFLFDGNETQLTASLKNSESESLQLMGTIPRMGSEEPVQIQLAANSYSIDWIRSLMDPDLIDELKGKVNGDILITGTTAEPNWNGRIRLQDGQLGMPILGKRKGMVVNSIQANFLFDGEVVTVDSLLARSGEGWLRGAGTIDIKDLKLGEYDIALTAEDFKAIDSPDYFAVVSGRMTLGGTTDRPKLGGRLTVHRGDFWLSDATTSDVFQPLALSDEDLAVLQRRFGLRIAATDTTSFDAYDVLALENFTVRMERDTWIRSKSNPKLDIQLTGDLDVRKKPKQDPEVFGSISILPERSRIIQFGKRFELDRGELTFNGPMKAPSLSLEASYTVPSRGSETEEVTIRLVATGTPEKLDVSFDSDPSMELADIFSYIATGRPAAASLQISGVQSDSYLQSAAGLALGPVTDLIENLASSGLGLDVIEIEHTGFSGLTLTAGKYVSPKLYVSVSQPISLSSSADASNSTGKNQTQVTMEYELVRQLLLSLVNRGTILRINLRWQLAF